ncbi:MAG: HAMP domain-containing histidine kinase [Planctomycetes bacterium]|nr:HAMP domain-containing histidine kinase [Planctomycetota bacterium]
MASPQTKADSVKKFSNPDGELRIGHVYLETASRQLHWLNETARRLHQEGVPFAAADLEKSALQRLDGKPAQAADLPLLKAWREGRAVEATFLLSRPGDRVDHVRWSASPLLGADGKVAAVFGTVLVGPPEPDWQVLAGLAHDLRTPLQAMQLFATLLETGETPAAETHEVTDSMRASAERASAIAKELLEWCRRPAQAGRRPERTLFPLRPFLTSLVDEHNVSARRKGLALVSRCDAADGWEIHTDQVRLGRLLSNLLSNAIRYTPHGRVDFTAQWRELTPTRGETDPFGTTDSARRRRASLVLSVVDTGVGIASEEQDAIFQPFERGRGADQEKGGSGVGLAIVERLVEELGLALEVYSVFGQGSAFDLIIPPRMLFPAQDAEPPP